MKYVQEVMEITAAFLQRYREDARYSERTFKWIKRVGFDGIKKAVVDDIDNRKRLCARLEAALSVTKDPWKERINVLAEKICCSGQGAGVTPPSAQPLL